MTIALTQEEYDIAMEEGETFWCDEKLVFRNLMRVVNKALKDPSFKKLELAGNLMKNFQRLKVKFMTHEEINMYKHKMTIQKAIIMCKICKKKVIELDADIYKNLLEENGEDYFDNMCHMDCALEILESV